MTVLRIEPVTDTPACEVEATALFELLRRLRPTATLSANALSDLASRTDVRAFVIRANDGSAAAASVATRVDTMSGLPQLPAGSWLVDLALIGAENRHRGALASIWTDVVEAMFAETAATLLVTFVDVSDRRLPTALEDAGFIWDEIFERPGRGRCWMMVANPPTGSSSKRGATDIDELLSRH